MTCAIATRRTGVTERSAPQRVLGFNKGKDIPAGSILPELLTQQEAERIDEQMTLPKRQ